MLKKVLGIVGLLIIATILAGWITTNHSYVTTPSMYPTIPPGSMIFVQRESSYHVGEVVEFRGNGLKFAHRIIRIQNGQITTKGDNPENSPDAFLPATTSADVIGKIVAAPRWLGFPELIAHHPGYGLAWLRTELGLTGKLLVVLAGGLLAWCAYRPSHRREGHRSFGSAVPDIDLTDHPSDNAQLGSLRTERT